MSNEELALMIQQGEREKLVELWEQVRRFARKQAKRWVNAMGTFGGVTLEDMMQVSFLATMEATDSFKPDICTFVNWYSFYLKKHFVQVLGLRTQLQKRDPLRTASSMDTPLDDDEGTFTLEDTLPDPEAERAFESIEDEDLHDVVERALATLTDQQRKVIRLRYWHDLTIEHAGKLLGVDRSAARLLESRALRTLRSPKISKELMKYR